MNDGPVTAVDVKQDVNIELGKTPTPDIGAKGQVPDAVVDRNEARKGRGAGEPDFQIAQADPLLAEPAAALAKDLKNLIAVADIRSLSTKEIASLSDKDVVAVLTPRQLKLMSSVQLKAFTSGHFDAIKKAHKTANPADKDSLREKFDTLTEADKFRAGEVLRPEEIKARLAQTGYYENTLSAIQLEQVHPRDIGLLDITKLTPDLFYTLSPEQKQALTPDQVKNLKVEQIEIDPIDFAQSFHPDKIQYLPTETLKNLSPDLIKALSSAQKQALTKKQIRALTADQIDKDALNLVLSLSPEQRSWFTNDQSFSSELLDRALEAVKKSDLAMQKQEEEVRKQSDDGYLPDVWIDERSFEKGTRADRLFKRFAVDYGKWGETRGLIRDMHKKYGRLGINVTHVLDIPNQKDRVLMQKYLERAVLQQKLLVDQVVQLEDAGALTVAGQANDPTSKRTTDEVVRGLEADVRNKRPLDPDSYYDPSRSIGFKPGWRPTLRPPIPALPRAAGAGPVVPPAGKAEPKTAVAVLSEGVSQPQSLSLKDEEIGAFVRTLDLAQVQVRKITGAEITTDGVRRKIQYDDLSVDSPNSPAHREIAADILQNREDGFMLEIQAPREMVA